MSFTISGLISYFVQESLRVMSTLGPTGVMILMILEGVGLPFPSEVIMVFAGFLSTGNIGLFVVYSLAGSFGGFLGNLILYYISYYGGRPLILFLGRYFGLKEEHLLRTEKWFDSRGEWTVFFGRFIPGFRSYMSVPAGISKMNVTKFSIFTFSGSLIWSVSLATGGYILGNSWNKLIPIVTNIGIILLVAFVLILVVYVIYRIRKNKKREEDSSYGEEHEDLTGR